MKLHSIKLNRTIIAAGIVAAACSAPASFAGEWEGDAKDAWIDGKLETSYLLNTELNNFAIDTNIDDGVVTLEGEVSSDIKKMLAEEIAKNTEGVQSVSNMLVVNEKSAENADQSRDVSTRFYDLTTTAGLKSNFAVNSEIDALDINIDTVDGVVTLEGSVDTEAEKMLAEQIAGNLDHVRRVVNNLKISG